MWDTLVGVDEQTRADYVGRGWWRDEATFADDLARHARERPDHPACIAYEGGAHARTLTYAEFEDVVARLATGLVRRGVGRRDVVLAYLPNVWPVPALYLACLRIGAVASPVLPTLSGRELDEVVTRSGARVCVTTAGELAERVAEAPGLTHRIAYGGENGTDGFESFDSLLAERDELPAPAAADDPVFLLYTSGTSGTMKAVVHTPNTLYAAARAVALPHRLGTDAVIAIPNYLTHMAGATYAGWLPVLLGATTVVQDTNTDMALLLDLVERHRITWAYCSPSYAPPLLAVQRERPRDVSSLAHLTCGSAPVHADLVGAVRETLGVELHTLWGMTENGTVTVTRDDDPADWGVHSDGRPEAWMELRIDPEPASADGSGRLWVRGASQCVGYLGQRELYEACLDADGWFDTGDLARPDGRGGIKITGRRTDLITRANGQKVSTLEVEAILRRNARIKDLALVGYPDPASPGGELVCAVVVPDGAPPMLEELHAYLDTERVAPVLWPDRVQFVWELPVNALGKVLRNPLRERLEIAARRPPR